MSSSPSKHQGDVVEALIDDDIEFAFAFNEQLKSPPLSAAELFDGGKIKPLKLLPRSQLQYPCRDSPKAPRSPKRMLTKAYLMSSHLRKTVEEELVDDDHSCTRLKRQNVYSKCLALATLSTTVSNVVSEPAKTQHTESHSLSSSSFSRSTSSSTSNSSSRSSWRRRWKFLFRSASDGHVTRKEEYNNKEDYCVLQKISQNEDAMSLSFRSEDGSNVGSRLVGRRMNVRSAHERHYMKSRAATEEMRRKTFLPYKKNLLGCMDLADPGVVEVSRWIGVDIRC